MSSYPPIVTGDQHSYMGKDPGMPGGFNADYYLAHNPDVAASGLDPLYHYDTYGKAEGRLAYDAGVTTGHAYWGMVTGQPNGSTRNSTQRITRTSSRRASTCCSIRSNSERPKVAWATTTVAEHRT